MCMEMLARGCSWSYRHSSEPPSVVLVTELRLLQEQYVFLPAKPSLQPSFHFPASVLRAKPTHLSLTGITALLQLNVDSSSSIWLAQCYTKRLRKLRLLWAEYRNSTPIRKKGSLSTGHLHTLALQISFMSELYAQLGMVAHTCNASPWEAEAGGSQVLGQPYSVILSDFLTAQAFLW